MRRDTWRDGLVVVELVGLAVVSVAAGLIQAGAEKVLELARIGVGHALGTPFPAPSPAVATMVEEARSLADPVRCEDCSTRLCDDEAITVLVAPGDMGTVPVCRDCALSYGVVA